ncbi:unnamed protein product [Plutella xylostella]|uniref:GPI inositol-deacylase n=1 Tax=Plutella xylostella TaxID=51655 RepID=A0A8S4DAS6_PLUXY|nr:unnamed protein product [Plutella xylostella]
MNFSKIISTSLFQIISLLFFIVYLLGFLNTHFSDRQNYCVMTYMFEYPQFVRITVPEDSIYPQYALYAYGEGRVTEKARKMWFDGIPVLFLPGNSGSHMQGRSLASVALRKAMSSPHEFHFDYFMVSFNEDLSGLYGGVLPSQTDYAAACIRKILSLYKTNAYTKTVPTSVILIGHSMGGLVAKRLLAYPDTIDVANIAITLAAPLEAPVINTDLAMDDYYKSIDLEWGLHVNGNPEVKNKKVLLTFGNGPRDLLVPSGLIASNDSDLNAVATAIPGVWVSPDHVSIVWCKQLVITITRFLFSIVDLATNQLTQDKPFVMSKARMYFQANRSTTLSPDIKRAVVSMQADAFWYEDNRRVYQIARPEITKTTYLMIRLVNYPQNRFVAIEGVNADDKDWLFGCNAQHVYGTHRYCKQATSLSELTRWAGAATDFGRRKLATVNLHDVKEKNPSWSHVVVRVSPTRRPIVLNVDINDLASRRITVDLPSDFSVSKQMIRHETEAGSLYYELILPGFNRVYQAFYLYVEPTPGCKASQYHASAEVHVPWAENHEYTHYFTQLKRSPMKMRLFKSNPNSTVGTDDKDHVKITLLLDPQCTYTISIANSWYHRLAQLTRHYTPVLVPYVAAIVLLAARSNLQHLWKEGSCLSMHSALMSDGVKPYYSLVYSRFAVLGLMTIPTLTFLFESSSWKHLELRYFAKSLLVLPAYMAALGMVNVVALAFLAIMVSSSQLAHRLLFRIVWRGGPNLAEKVASGLQKLPLLVSLILVMSAPLSCGAASLAAGAAFYAFMISKMYEEYLEDYVYKIMAKIAARICRVFSKKRPNTEGDTQSNAALVPKEDTTSQISAKETSDENKPKETKEIVDVSNNKDTVKENKDTDKDNEIKDKELKSEETQALVAVSDSETRQEVESKEESKKSRRRRKSDHEMDEELSNLHFHTMMFFLWMVVTLINVPCLLTWARNFKYSMVLKPDTSYHTGLIMSVCSSAVWQIEGPRRNKRCSEFLSALLFTMAVFILSLGPLSLTIVNYSVTFMFAMITVQQYVNIFDEDVVAEETPVEKPQDKDCDNSSSKEDRNDEPGTSHSGDKTSDADDKTQSSEATQSTPDCNVCNENRIYNVFKNLREKFNFNEDL